jgi:hypothetical protein
MEATRAEERDLHAYQAYVSAAVPVPPGAEEIADCKEKS